MEVIQPVADRRDHMGEVDTVSVSTRAVPRAVLEQCFRELPNYVVLRNHEDVFANLERGGDVDLLVENLELAERALIQRLGRPVRILRSSYVTGYSYDWGHIDLLPSIEWRGASFLPTSAVLEGRQLSARGRPVPRIAHEALISWLTNLLFGGAFKAPYAVQIRSAVEIDGHAFRQALVGAAGSTWGVRLWEAAVAGRAETSAQWSRSLRRAVWWRACVRSPMRTVERYVAYVVAELRLRFRPPVPWIAIVASDGHATLSLQEALVRRFARCPYGNVEVFQWRPDSSSHSRVRLLMPAAAWLAAYWTRLVHLRAKGYVVAHHGMHLGPVVDPRRGRYAGVPRFARVLWSLLPRPDLVFVLGSEPNVGRAEMERGPRSELARRPRRACHVLDGRVPLSDLVDQVQSVVRAWMSNRARAESPRTREVART
jgi:hypothetical protein